MKYNSFGKLGKISRLTLGGGGIGQVWGETTPEEAIATLHMALDSGIDTIDSAPGYVNCEKFIGEAFKGRLAKGIRITTKFGVAQTPPDQIYARARASLEKSLKDMRLERVDLFFLHNEIRPDFDGAPEGHDHFTRWSTYRDHVIPAFERLKADGLIGDWGITGFARAQTILDALEHEHKPAAVQAVVNLLDSAGGLYADPEVPRHREIIATARTNGVAVMGIRAVQAGALTNAFDRDLPEDHLDMIDYKRAAPFRALCEAWGENPAIVAHRYALGMEGVETLVLGVKNQRELAQCLDAEALGPLDGEQIAAIDALRLGAVTQARLAV